MNSRFPSRRRALLCGLLALGATPWASAQSWPSKPVTVIVPFPAGGGTDAFARPLSAMLTKQLGRQVIIDNKGGAGGTLGAGLAAHAAPDGYTFFMGAVHHAIAPAVYPKLDYNLQTDFIPVALVSRVPQVIVINPGKVPVTNLREFVAYAKANPGKLTYASANATGQVSSALFAQMAGLDLLHVPYKASPTALTDVLNGTVSMMFVDIPPAIGHVNAGKLRAFGVTTAQRSSLLPGIPSIAEGGLPGYEVFAWTAICAPAGTPPEIVRRLHDEIAKILAKADIRDAFARVGVEVQASTPEQLAAFIGSERDRWSRLIRMAHIEAE